MYKRLLYQFKLVLYIKAVSEVMHDMHNNGTKLVKLSEKLSKKRIDKDVM